MMNNIKILVASGLTISLVLGAGYLTKRKLEEKKMVDREDLDDRE